MDNPIAEAYVKMLQERKKAKDAKLDDGDGMDPVGQGDADIDNDGDTDSSDEYLHKRRTAIKKSLKKEENEDVDEARNKAPKIKKSLADVSVKGISKRANNMARTGKTESVDEVRQLKDPKKEVMVVDKNGKNMVIDKSKQKEFLSKGWKLSESVVEETDAPLIAQIFAEAKGKKLSPDDIRKALASKKAQAKGKDKVSLKKAPWESKSEAVDIETDDAKTDVDDPKAKKKSGEKKSGKGDPAAVNAPSQDDRAAAADAPDPSLDPDAEPTPPKEKEAPAPKKDKIAVKKKPSDEKEESVKKESFNWNEISEMNDEQVDAYIDSLDESQLDAFESEMNEAANVDGDAGQQDKEQSNFILKHRTGQIVDRPDADKPKDDAKVAPKRPGDKTDGDKKPVKTMKDIRK
jgi:hypothetical protein|tara:strand:+ start:16 stop:1230 length:1215 start_codon:yes stop_codon:yes gene_type:complete